MKQFLFFLFTIIAFASFSQGIINNSAYLVLTSGSYIYVDGDGNGGYTNTGTGYINSDGTLSLEGSWINNGSTDVYTSIDNTGATVFSGTTLQQIGGTHSTTFENLTMNNTGTGANDGAYISQDEKIQYTLTMTDGDFDLLDYTVQLVDATSTVISESGAKRIKATSGGVDGAGTGTIYTIRTNPSGNIANLGLNLVSAMTGSITITRGHLEQSGAGSFSANGSVFRYFQVSPATNGGGGLNVTFQNCYIPELNGHISTELIMYQWMEVNSSGIEYWSPLPDNTSGGSVAITQTLRNSTLNYFKVTLGSVTTPLPVELKSFTAHCQDGGKLINWTTASEINNDYFTLEKSTDGKDFYTMAIILGAGNSNIENNYQYFDSEPSDGILYYRLSQTDFNGNEQVFNIVSANCSGNSMTEDNFIIINNPANESVQLQLTGTEGNRYTLSFIDQLDRQLIEKKIILDNPNQTITVNTQNLSEGIYSVVYWSDKNVITKQLIITK